MSRNTDFVVLNLTPFRNSDGSNVFSLVRSRVLVEFVLPNCDNPQSWLAKLHNVAFLRLKLYSFRALRALLAKTC